MDFVWQDGSDSTAAATNQRPTGTPILNGNEASLPPIGVFWDIENCQVPCGKSALAVCECIRERYFKCHRELEFMCVCDTSKENKDVIQEIISAQVTVVHVNATSKNAADDKLRQLMRRFADNNAPPATIILISGDVNFAPDLSDLRHRKKFNVIVVHNGFPSEALLACAHEYSDFHELVASLPRKVKTPASKSVFELTIKNLPSERDAAQIKARLGRLSENCGGKVVSVVGTKATIRFTSQDAADRAKKRMDCEDVFGKKISVSFPSNGHDSYSSFSDFSHNGKKGYGTTKSPMFTGMDGTHKAGREQHPKSQAHRKCQFPPPPPLPGRYGEQLPSYDSWESQRDQKPQIQHDPGVGVGPDGDNGRSKRGGWKTSGASDYWPGNRSAQDAAFLKRTISESSDRRVRGVSAVFEDESGGDRLTDGWLSYSNGQNGLNNRWGTSPVPTDNSGGRRSAGSVPPSSGQQQQQQQSSCSPQMREHSPYSYVNGSTYEQVLDHIQESGDPVELLITNLDQGIEAKELKTRLQSLFREHVMVLHVSVNLSPDGSLTAGIKVPSTQDAQYAISRLHRRRIGAKRIMISVANGGASLHPFFLRSEVVALLTDVPGKKLPLFKFRELFEKRYHRSIGVSDLHKLHDVVTVQENVNGRMVVLSSDFRNTPSPACSDGSKEVQDILDMSRCGLHCPNDDDGKGWAEKEQTFMLPNVIITLKALSANIHSLLQLHANSIPLNSLTTCYECEFGKLETVVEGGVPLEHLVTCVVGVRITRGPSGVKRLEWIEDGIATEHCELRNVSPPLANQLSLFCREIVDLLKNHPYCRVAFTKFIPAYHHHFGRQCRVADYGYTKLLDLFSALTHVVQILGDGNKRFLTLTHRAQVKRFTADLLRILKSQPSKLITMYEFPEVYSKCIGKPFEIMNYGVCDLMDILPEITEGTAVVTGTGSQMIITIPKREQTSEEMHRTKQFAADVVELMRHSPRYRMEFTKFIPAYHHNFGRQCRVSDYGVTKLIDLFEAIPETVIIKNSEVDTEDKVLQLADHEMLKVFGEQIRALMSAPGRHILSLEKLLSIFIQMNGYSLDPEDFGAMDVRELLDKIPHVIKVIETSGGLLVTLVDQGQTLLASKCAKKILFNVPDGKMNLREFEKQFYLRCSIRFDLGLAHGDLKDVVKLESIGQSQVVSLHPVQLLIREIVQLLNDLGGRMLLSNFNAAYAEKFGKPCCPAQFGHPNLAALLQSMHEIFSMRGRGAKRTIVVDKERVGPYLSGKTPGADRRMAASEPPKGEIGSVRRQPVAPTNVTRNSNHNDVDLMSDPIPCRLPSPMLCPLPVQRTEQELIRFDNVTPELCESGNLESKAVGSASGFSNFGSDDSQEQIYQALQANARSTSPLFPPPSLLPQVPATWIYRNVQTSIPPPPPVHSTQTMEIPSSPCKNYANESSDAEMSTPPCIREVIASSSPDCTPIREGGSSGNRYRARIAAQFSNPLMPVFK